MLNPYIEVLVWQEVWCTRNDRGHEFNFQNIYIVNLKWQLVSISNMRSILLIKPVATSHLQNFERGWGTSVLIHPLINMYFKRMIANYTFLFYFMVSAYLPDNIWNSILGCVTMVPVTTLWLRNQTSIIIVA